MTERSKNMNQHEAFTLRGWRPLQPFGAWLLACLVAGLVMLILAQLVSIFTSGLPRIEPFPSFVLLGIFTILFVSWFVAIITAIPATILVLIIRHFGWRRGWSDSLLAGAIIGIVVLFDMQASSNWALFRETSIFFIAGAAGGLTYWHAAGRPKPPY